jgi:outer membrane protein assembly factor BamB
LSVLVVLLLIASSRGDDWPQWQGPERNGTWSESGVVKSIPADGLPVKWRVPTGLGYAGPAVAEGRVYLLDYERTSGEIANNPGAKDQLTGQERVRCLDAATGDVIWEYAYQQPYAISYGSGPRATPTVDGDLVYALGAEGRLTCLTAGKGDLVWSRDFKQDYGATTPHWGHSAHPLVVGDLVICLAGGPGSAVVAFNKVTGEEVWRALSAPDVGYCPPTLARTVDPPALLVWLPDAVRGLDPQSGDVHWSVELKPDYGMSIAAPVVQERAVYLSGVVNHSVLLELAPDGQSAKELWRGKGMTSISCSHSGPIVVDGTIYGCDDKGWLRAVDLQTGDRLWETLDATTGQRPAGYATVFLVRNGDLFYLFNDSGDLIVAGLTRDGYTEHGRFHVLEPTSSAFGRPVVWSHPAFAERCLFARNDREIVCVSLAAE